MPIPQIENCSNCRHRSTNPEARWCLFIGDCVGNDKWELAKPETDVVSARNYHDCGTCRHSFLHNRGINICRCVAECCATPTKDRWQPYEPDRVVTAEVTGAWIDKAPRIHTPQEIRIAESKEDLKLYTGARGGGTKSTLSPPRFNSAITTRFGAPELETFYVFLYDEKRRPRVTICYLFDGAYYHRGIAICAPEDYGKFTKKEGRIRAHRRAAIAHYRFKNSGRTEPEGKIRKELRKLWAILPGAIPSATFRFKYLPQIKWSELAPWERESISRQWKAQKVKAQTVFQTRLISTCCGAPVRVETGNDFFGHKSKPDICTAWYVCELCHNPCDFLVVSA